MLNVTVDALDERGCTLHINFVSLPEKNDREGSPLYGRNVCYAGAIAVSKPSWELQGQTVLVASRTQ